MRTPVTLITPVYHAMPYLRDYLGCVLEQSWRPLQFIAVDDGSTDGSGACLEEFLPALEEAGITVHLISIPHRGQAAAINAALPLVTGEYLTWCDADDRMTPDSIEKKAIWLDRFPEFGMVRSDGIVIDGDTGQRLCASAGEADRLSRDIFDALFRGTTYCYAGCYMVRTALLFACYPEKQIPLSPEGQNLQLLLPPASRSPCGFLPEALHCYCRRGSGHSSRKRSYREARERLENFSKLRQAVLPYCRCDQGHYLMVDRMVTEAAEQELLRAAVIEARKEMRR